MQYLRTQSLPKAFLGDHPEASRHIDRSLALIRDEGCKAGLVFNPATPLDCLEYVIDKVDMVLLMSVNPGFGGQSFIPATLDKLRQARKIRGEEMHALMLLAMAASYDPDPQRPERIRLPFDLRTCTIDPERWQAWLEFDPLNLLEKHADALRTLAVAYKRVPDGDLGDSPADYEQDIVIVGIHGIVDPPRAEVPGALDDRFHVAFGHRLADLPVDDEAAAAVEDGAQVVEGPRDVQV